MAFEESLSTILPGGISHPLVTKKVTTLLQQQIYDLLKYWTNKMGKRKYGISNISEIFSLLLIVEEKNGTVKGRTFNKESLTVEKICGLYKDTNDYDNRIALSFFLLGQKINQNDSESDYIIGISIYDLKNRRLLAFNIQSLSAFSLEHQINEDSGLQDIADYLFNMAVNNKLEFRSHIPLPIYSPYYTALPWICYSVLLPIELENFNHKLEDKNLSLLEFFTFGFPAFPEDGNSFVFENFSSMKEGRATCIMNFNDNGKSIVYNLRFDQSPGERLIHLDYSFYYNKKQYKLINNKKQYKLINHKPLDFEEVYKFNVSLFVAMMFAGLFDAHFSTLYSKGIKGLKELAMKNPAFLYPTFFIWMIEIFTSRLDGKGFAILEKLHDGIPLEESELQIIKGIHYGDFRMWAQNNQGDYGLNPLGYAVLLRHRRGQSNIRIT